VTRAMLARAVTRARGAATRACARERWRRCQGEHATGTRAVGAGRRERARRWSASASGDERSENGRAETSGRVAAPVTGAKQRLDELTVARNPELSRNVAQSWIAQGKVLVDGQPVTKAGTKLKPSVKIEVIAEQPKFVCRAD